MSGQMLYLVDEYSGAVVFLALLVAFSCLLVRSKKTYMVGAAFALVCAAAVAAGMAAAAEGHDRAKQIVAQIEADADVEITEHPQWASVIRENISSDSWVINGARWDCEVTDADEAQLECLATPVDAAEGADIGDLAKTDPSA